MSASGYKQTSRRSCRNVRFTPESRHSDAQERVGLKKRTFDVRLAPESGHAEVLAFGGSAVAAVPGRSAQISLQGDPIAPPGKGPLRRPRAKIQIPGLGVLKRADAEGKGQTRQ